MDANDISLGITFVMGAVAAWIVAWLATAPARRAEFDQATALTMTTVGVAALLAGVAGIVWAFDRPEGLTSVTVVWGSLAALFVFSGGILAAVGLDRLDLEAARRELP
ncbi:MAG TPA: hypothetical protein ENK55_04340 [Actinobacteria bacterium]|nr:hypothetical protein [Actinomycetota bacterium]